MKSCPKCGADADSAKFCRLCGAKMEEMGEGTSADLDSDDTVIPPAPDATFVLATPTYPQTADTSPAAPEKRTKPLLIGIAAGIAALVIASVLVIMMIVQPNNRYNLALRQFDDGRYAQALETLEMLPPGYKDIDDLRPYYEAYAAFGNGDYRTAAERFGRLGSYGESEAMRDESNYIYAMELLESGSFDEAHDAFDALSGYKDSADMMMEARYKHADSLMAHDGALAREMFAALGDYRDSADKITESDYYAAVGMLERGEYSEAYKAFNELGSYKDSEIMMLECSYRMAVRMLDEGDYDGALEQFAVLGDYNDSADMQREVNYRKSFDLLDDKDYSAAFNAFNALGDYKDSREMLLEVQYLFGIDLFNDGDYNGAIIRFERVGDYKDSMGRLQECLDLLADVWKNAFIEILDNARDYVRETDKRPDWFGPYGLYNDGNFALLIMESRLDVRVYAYIHSSGRLQEFGLVSDNPGVSTVAIQPNEKSVFLASPRNDEYGESYHSMNNGAFENVLYMRYPPYDVVSAERNGNSISFTEYRQHRINIESAAYLSPIYFNSIDETISAVSNLGFGGNYNQFTLGPIGDYMNLSTNYVISDSNVRYLTDSDVRYLSAGELELARNEIYARHGRIFAAQRMREHFESKVWYSGYIQPGDFNENVFNAYERANIRLIQEWEKR